MKIMGFFILLFGWITTMNGYTLENVICMGVGAFLIYLGVANARR